MKSNIIKRLRLLIFTWSLGYILMVTRPLETILCRRFGCLCKGALNYTKGFLITNLKSGSNILHVTVLHTKPNIRYDSDI